MILTLGDGGLTDPGLGLATSGYISSKTGGEPSYYGILKRWTGAAWVESTLAVYLSGLWQSKPLMVWDGAVWQEVKA